MTTMTTLAERFTERVKNNAGQDLRTSESSLLQADSCSVGPASVNRRGEDIAVFGIYNKDGMLLTTRNTREQAEELLREWRQDLVTALAEEAVVDALVRDNNLNNVTDGKLNAAKASDEQDIRKAVRIEVQRRDKLPMSVEFIDENTEFVAENLRNAAAEGRDLGQVESGWYWFTELLDHEGPFDTRAAAEEAWNDREETDA